MITSIRTTLAALALAGASAGAVAATAPVAGATQPAVSTITMPADVGQRQPISGTGDAPPGPGALPLGPGGADGRPAYTTVSGARIRASVPGGRILGTASYNAEGLTGCKIPGSDGHLWGWVGYRIGINWTSGWMRDDLFKVWYNSTNSGWWGTASQLPWC
ncbi:MAG TPA: hypothetical protein VGL46_09570 [Pseudonocardiaceae bacterium]|jgi:hypothetical protein